MSAVEGVIGSAILILLVLDAAAASPAGSSSPSSWRSRSTSTSARICPAISRPVGLAANAWSSMSAST